MELFELLFIALFILFPILEQVLRRGKTQGPEESTPDELGGEGTDLPETESDATWSRPSERESGRASDMLPDDLWAVLTGEERHGEGVAVEEEPAAPPPPPAASVPDEWEEAWTPRPEPSWRLDEEEPAAPVSLERYGPEAYSLEVPAPDVESLARRVPSAEERHRRFHELIQQPTPRRPVRRSRVGRALRTPESLRQAFVLTEVLGTPKGLE